MKKKITKSLLSVIVPAYRQEKTIKNDLKNILETLDNSLIDHYDYEVICVVDGIVDKTKTQALQLNNPHLKVLWYKLNRGKGYAVRFGMTYAKGQLISFLDAGMDISPKGIMMLLAHMEWYGADIIVGSKRHPVSKVNYPILRKILSFGYHFGVKLLFGFELNDTQSGLKIFKKNVIKEILPRLSITRYAMDIEMLAVAYELGFTRIFEAPIEVKFDVKTSNVKWQTSFLMALDTLKVFYRLKFTDFYTKK